MASTTSNTDLVPREALDELKALDTQLKTTIDNMQALLKPVKEINNALSKSATNYKALTDAINKLNAVEEDYKKNATEHKRLKTEIEKLHVRLAQAQSAEAKEVAVLKEQIRQQNLEIKNSAREMLSASGSIDQLRARINVLTLQYNAMSEAVRNSDVGQNMQKQIKEMNDQVSVLEQGVGNYRRNVGNYASGFTPLQFQVQQLARELPSLTVSAQQFFLAISNNLPMFADELVRVRAENKALNKDHKQSTPVWKQLLGAITSWQTALVVGITVITAYGKEIGAFFKQLFTGKSTILDTEASLRKLNESVDFSNVADSVVKLKELQSAWNALGDDLSKKTAFIKENRDELNKLGIAVSNVSEADNLFINNTDAYIKAQEYRAMADAARKLSVEKYGEYLKNLKDAENELLEGPGFGDYIQGFFKTNEYDFFPLGIPTNIPDPQSLITGAWWGEIEDNANVYNFIDVSKIKEQGQEALTESKFFFKEFNKLKKAEDDTLKNAGFKIYDPDAERRKQEEERRRQEEIRRQKEINDTYKQLAQSQLEARRELSVSMMEASAEENKAIVENENAFYEDRYAALIAFAEQKKQAIQQSAQAQIDALIQETAKELELNVNNKDHRIEIEKQLADQINLIRWKASEEAKAIDRERGDTAIELEEQRVAGIIKQIAREAAVRGQEMSMDESNELKQLAGNYAAGLLTAEQYEQAKTDVTRRYAKERFDLEIGMLEKQLSETMDPAESLNLMKEIDDKKLEYSKWVNSQEIADDLATAKKKEEIEKQLQDKRKELIGEVFNFANTLMAAQTEAQLADLERQSEQNEEWAEEEKERIDRLEEAGAISKEQADARKAAVDDQAAAREDELEQKKKEIRRKQAIADKVMAVNQIAIATAMAIMRIWADVPKMDFGISTVALTAVAAAIGAVQTATVLATPIPEYAHGTQDHPGGLAVVGDGGRPEMIVTPGGSVYKTPATDTLLDLPEHSVVLPDFSQAINALAFEKLPEIPVRQTDSAIKLSEMEGLFKTTNKQIGAFMDSFNRYKANRRYDSMFNRKKTTKIS